MRGAPGGLLSWFLAFGGLAAGVAGLVSGRDRKLGALAAGLAAGLFAFLALFNTLAGC